MTPYQAVLWAAAIYDPIKPGTFKQIFRIGDWIVGYGLDRDSNPVFAIAGSERREDFEADADFLPTNGAQLGMVHEGFYRDGLSVFAALRPLMLGKISITGHSLGASRAAILAGLCAINGIPVASLFMFEPAKPGYADLGKIVRAHVPDIICTRNARDFVPDLPPDFPFPYRHIIDPVDLEHPTESVDPAQDHMILPVIAGVLKRWPE